MSILTAFKSLPMQILRYAAIAAAGFALGTSLCWLIRDLYRAWKAETIVELYGIDREVFTDIVCIAVSVGLLLYALGR